MTQGSTLVQGASGLSLVSSIGPTTGTGDSLSLMYTNDVLLSGNNGVLSAVGGDVSLLATTGNVIAATAAGAVSLQSSSIVGIVATTALALSGASVQVAAETADFAAYANAGNVFTTSSGATSITAGALYTSSGSLTSINGGAGLVLTGNAGFVSLSSGDGSNPVVVNGAGGTLSLTAGTGVQLYSASYISLTTPGTAILEGATALSLVSNAGPTVGTGNSLDLAYTDHVALIGGYGVLAATVGDVSLLASLTGNVIVASDTGIVSLQSNTVVGINAGTTLALSGASVQVTSTADVTTTAATINIAANTGPMNLAATGALYATSGSLTSVYSAADLLLHGAAGVSLISDSGPLVVNGNAGTLSLNADASVQVYSTGSISLTSGTTVLQGTALLSLYSNTGPTVGTGDALSLMYTSDVLLSGNNGVLSAVGGDVSLLATAGNFASQSNMVTVQATASLALSAGSELSMYGYATQLYSGTTGVISTAANLDVGVGGSSSTSVGGALYASANGLVSLQGGAGLLLGSSGGMTSLGVDGVNFPLVLSAGVSGVASLYSGTVDIHAPGTLSLEGGTGWVSMAYLRQHGQLALDLFSDAGPVAIGALTGVDIQAGTAGVLNMGGGLGITAYSSGNTVILTGGIASISAYTTLDLGSPNVVSLWAGGDTPAIAGTTSIMLIANGLTGGAGGSGELIFLGAGNAVTSLSGGDVSFTNVGNFIANANAVSLSSSVVTSLSSSADVVVTGLNSVVIQASGLTDTPLSLYSGGNAVMQAATTLSLVGASVALSSATSDVALMSAGNMLLSTTPSGTGAMSVYTSVFDMTATANVALSAGTGLSLHATANMALDASGTLSLRGAQSIILNPTSGDVWLTPAVGNAVVSVTGSSSSASVYAAGSVDLLGASNAALHTTSSTGNGVSLWSASKTTVEANSGVLLMRANALNTGIVLNAGSVADVSLLARNLVMDAVSVSLGLGTTQAITALSDFVSVYASSELVLGSPSGSLYGIPGAGLSLFSTAASGINLQVPSTTGGPPSEVAITPGALSVTSTLVGFATTTVSGAAWATSLALGSGGGGDVVAYASGAASLVAANTAAVSGTTAVVAATGVTSLVGSSVVLAPTTGTVSITGGLQMGAVYSATAATITPLSYPQIRSFTTIIVPGNPAGGYGTDIVQFNTGPALGFPDAIPVSAVGQTFTVIYDPAQDLWGNELSQPDATSPRLGAMTGNYPNFLLLTFDNCAQQHLVYAHTAVTLTIYSSSGTMCSGIQYAVSGAQYLVQPLVQGGLPAAGPAAYTPQQTYTWPDFET